MTRAADILARMGQNGAIPDIGLRGAMPLPGLLATSMDVLERWPDERPLACVWGHPDAERKWARWTILAEPEEWVEVERDGTNLIPEGAEPGGPVVDGPDVPPFRGGWIGYLGYELGRVLEPVVRAAPRRGREGWPLGGWYRCRRAMVRDEWMGRWWAVGEHPEEAARLADEVLRQAPRRTFRIGPLTSSMGRRSFVEAARRAVEYIRAGDVFQVNLAHRITGKVSGGPRGVFGALVDRAAPRHGAYLALPGEPMRAVLSTSPEMFLRYDHAMREVTTRPMKGTRPLGAGARALETSEKDRAELAMIVDLMRNDLGRVCEFGSIRVAEPRVIERHGDDELGVWQGVATVRGTLRAGLGLGELLRATFPPGSVTGAPKIRAMQIIEELEALARGPYCGAIGTISTTGDALFSVAIRTAVVTGDVLDYFVGAGIVADSDPEAEWRETIAKARTITSMATEGVRGL